MTSEPDGRNPLVGMPSTAEWQRLTVLPAKQELLDHDLYFREGWADVLDVLGDEAVGVVEGLAMIAVKPDAVVGRRLHTIVDYLLAHGFVPVAETRFAYNRHSMREVWRYDWHVYTVDRLQLCSLWYPTNDVLLLLARDERPEPGVPATVRLSELKGLGDPALRGPHHLRTLLNPPNRILNFVHVGDEPADVVRELAIFLDRDERRRFLAEVRAHHLGDRTAQARAAIDRIEGDVPSHDLDVEAALNRLTPVVGEPTTTRLRGLVRGHGELSWDEFTALVPVDDVPRWDVIVLASFVVRNERPVPHALLPPVEVAEWRARAGGHPS